MAVTESLRTILAPTADEVRAYLEGLDKRIGEHVEAAAELRKERTQAQALMRLLDPANAPAPATRKRGGGNTRPASGKMVAKIEEYLRAEYANGRAIHATEIAAALGVHSTSVAKALDQLAGSGLVRLESIGPRQVKNYKLIGGK
jgi:hypothetical protein